MEGLARAAAALVVAALASSASLNGSFALHGGKAAVSAHLSAAPQADGRVRLDIYQTKLGSATPIRAYETDMTKLMHMIVLSDDFTQFQHVHPAYDAATGHFTITVPVERGHVTHVFTDTEPTGIGQQVFRFDYADGSPHAPVGMSTPSPRTAHAGPYAVTLSTTEIAAMKPQVVNVEIDRNAKPASGLRTYLGAAAHAVFIDTKTLAYVHVHPMVPGAMMQMNADGAMDMHDDGPAQAGPKLMMHVPALAAGSYRLWLQFQGTSLETVPFTIVAR